MRMGFASGDAKYTPLANECVVRIPRKYSLRP